MVVLDIFSKNIQIKYKAHILSKATFFVLIFGLVSVVLPFIFAYKSGGLWLKRDVFYQQPSIRFNGKYIFFATTNKLNVAITCSSYPHLEPRLEMMDFCSTIKFREIDHNIDGKSDEFEMDLEISLPDEVYVTSITLILAIEYKLNGFCPLQMQSALIHQDLLSTPVSNYLAVGDVAISQREPVVCHLKRINNLYNDSLVMDEENVNNYMIRNLIGNYAKRNVSTKLTNLYTSFSPDYSKQFDLQLKFKYPENRIIYKPGFWHIVKWAWIQYFAIYMVISGLVASIKSYLFNRRLVLFYEDNPFKKQN